MPDQVVCDGRRYEHVQTFKLDFFAGTGLYRSGQTLAVLKLGRQSDLCTAPAAWIGRLLTRREARFYRMLHDVPGVPRLIGVLPGDAGFLHEFVPGRPLERNAPVGDTFFDELFALVRELHRRHLAYVDLNKRQNVLIGDDGRPYLIDFQIALHLPPIGWRRFPLVRRLLAGFQHADWYHCHKHKRRCRPDLLTDAESRVAERLGFWIRVHRRWSRPLTQLRRQTLRRLRRGEERTIAGVSTK
jgi:hypothetical protein